MKNKFLIALLFLSGGLFNASAQQKAAGKIPSFKLSFAPGASKAPITGRMFLIIANKDTTEPRLQVGRYGPYLFGVDVTNLKPSTPVTVDSKVLGYPSPMKDIPPVLITPRLY
jgi:hypothetical protein